MAGVMMHELTGWQITPLDMSGIHLGYTVEPPKLGSCHGDRQTTIGRYLAISCLIFDWLEVVVVVEIWRGEH